MKFYIETRVRFPFGKFQEIRNLTPVYSEICFSKNACFINFGKNEHHGRHFSM